MCKKSILAVSLLSSPLAMAYDDSLLQSENIVSPTQLHQVKDKKVEASGKYTRFQTKKGDKLKLSEMQYKAGSSFRVSDELVLGLEAKHSVFDSNFGSQDGQATVLSPTIAYTLGDTLTLGVQGEFGSLDKQVINSYGAIPEGGEYEDRQYSRYKAGLAVHQEGYELGLAYTPKYEKDGLLLREEYLAHGRTSLTQSLDAGLIGRYSPKEDGITNYDVTLVSDYKFSHSLKGQAALTYYNVDGEGLDGDAYEAKIGAYYDVTKDLSLGANVAYKIGDTDSDLANIESDQYSLGASLAYRF